MQRNDEAVPVGMRMRVMAFREDRTTVDVHRAANPLSGLWQPVTLDEELDARALAHTSLSSFMAGYAMISARTGCHGLLDVGKVKGHKQ